MRSKQYWLGLFAYYIAAFLYRTLRITVKIDPAYQANHQYLFAFWHGKQFLAAFQLLHQHPGKGAVLVSPSKDGDMLAVWIKKLGYDVVRGSSRHNNVRALSAMIRAIKAGTSLGLGVDGPIGPIYKVKPGLTYMAQKFGVKIIPVGAAFSRKWVFKKAWDKYEIPKPFSKGVCYIGAPIFIEPSSNLEECNLMLEESINAANRKAEELLSGKASS